MNGDSVEYTQEAPSSVGDFTPFYIIIAISSVLLGSIIILNIVCCCWDYSEYWLDRHTGNRWLMSVWSATPHRQPPLDLGELKSADELQVIISQGQSPPYHRQVSTTASQLPLTSYDHSATRESAI